jgi:hypothetical protein
MFSVPLVLFVNVLDPSSAVVTVIVPVLENVPFAVNVATDMVALLEMLLPEIVTAVKVIDVEPLMAFDVPENVYVPVPLLNVPLMEKFPGRVSDTLAAVLLNVPPLSSVKSPLNAFVPVAEEIVRTPPF